MAKPKPLRVSTQLDNLSASYCEEIINSKLPAKRYQAAYRTDKTMIMLRAGEIKPNPKCKKCRNRGYTLICPPGSKPIAENFNAVPCDCTFSQVKETDLEKVLANYLKHKEDEERRIAAREDSGTGPEPTQDKRGAEGQTKPIKKKKTPPTDAGRGEEDEAIGTPVQKPRKKRAPNKSKVAGDKE